MGKPLHVPLDPPQLTQLRIIGWALVIGAVLFAAIATALPFLTGGPSPAGDSADASLVRLLSMVHGALFLGGLSMATVLPSHFAKRVPEGQEQGLFVLRWAMLEGPALFGSVILLLAGQDGVLPDQPVYYANLLSTVTLFLFVATDTGRLGDAAKGG